MTKAMATILLMVFFLFVIPQQHSMKSVILAPQGYPKVLLFSAVDVYYLADSVQFWGEKVGVNGFFLAYLADWWTPREKLFENVAILMDVNKKGTSYGIDRNFVKVALGYGKLPIWTDDEAWSGILSNFRNIAEFIKQSGTRGIAIDTEPYEVPLFDPETDRFKTVDRKILKDKVYQRGKEIMQSLTEGFPDIEVVILPEGAFYWFNQDQGSSARTYELWIDFFNGMASVRNKKGIVVSAERTYSVTDKNSLYGIYNMINKTMLEHVQDPVFWKEKCSIALGMWPLGKTYSDKSARYSVARFEEQFLQAEALSPRYVWIYGHGAAWFQLKQEEVKKYSSHGRTVQGKEDQVIPTDSAILEYYDVVKQNRAGTF
jgi:hypothetical protein